MVIVYMPKTNPDEFARIWGERLKASLDRIRAGVEKVTTAPSDLAIKNKERMKARLIEAIDRGVWENALKKYTLDEWKRDMIEKGVSRIPSGVDAALNKVREFAAQLLPYIDAGLKELEKMPKVTLEDSVARASAWIRYMAKFRKK